MKAVIGRWTTGKKAAKCDLDIQFARILAAPTVVK